jgi:hypothetical protein
MMSSMSARLVVVRAVVPVAMSARLVVVHAVVAAVGLRVATARRVPIPLGVAVPVISHLSITTVRRVPDGGANRTIVPADVVVIPA